ncbi:MAG: DUF2726 domain-containing protein [Caldimonas sp.]
MSRPPKPVPLPTEWALSARPVFSSDERRVYRLLREALPHHIVLPKLPLVRFCQPNDPAQVRFWYDLLGTNNVTFAITSANGRVLAAIDLDTDRGNSKRVLQIKNSVLGACRVRYLRCPVDNLPTVAELQLLVPSSSAPGRGPQPAVHRPQQFADRRSTPRSGGGTGRRPDRASTLWDDSTVFQDSFFAPDSRQENFGNSEAGGPASVWGAAGAAGSNDSEEPAPSRPTEPDPDAFGGMMIDPPKPTPRPRS